MDTFKIRFTRDVVAGGQARSAGDIADIPYAEAWERIHSGDAVPSTPISKPENAALPAADNTAMLPRTKKTARKK